jgi:hypothetical protein
MPSTTTQNPDPSSRSGESHPIKPNQASSGVGDGSSRLGILRRLRRPAKRFRRKRNILPYEQRFHDQPGNTDWTYHVTVLGAPVCDRLKAMLGCTRFGVPIVAQKQIAPNPTKSNQFPGLDDPFRPGIFHFLLPAGSAGQLHPLLNPNSEVALGSAPAPGAVFRALAENLVRTT